MATDDACLWTPKDVAHFFRTSLPQLVSTLPHSEIPDCESFAECLEKLGVSGYVLLKIVDTAFLENRCKISSLAAISTVLYTITRLKNASSTFHKLEFCKDTIGLARQEVTTLKKIPRRVVPELQISLVAPAKRLAEPYLPDYRFQYNNSNEGHSITDEEQSLTIVSGTVTKGQSAYAHSRLKSFFKHGFSTENSIDESGETNGEWDFLLRKYPDTKSSATNGENSQVLGDDLNSDALSSRFEAELAEEFIEAHNPAIVSFEKSSRIIEQEIREIQEAWRESKKVSKTSRAAKIWRSSRQVRSDKVAHCRKVVQRLEHRLRKLKGDLLSQEWKNASQLQKQCSCLQPTIEDIEEQNWKITILESNIHPSKPQRAKGTTKRPSSLCVPKEPAAPEDHWIISDDSDEEPRNSGRKRKREVIDISSDSDNELPTLATQQWQAQVTVNSKATHPLIQSTRFLSYEQIQEEGNVKKLMVKLLGDLTPKDKEKMLSHIRSIDSVSAASSISKAFCDELDDIPLAERVIIVKEAQLYKCWTECDPRFIDEDPKEDDAGITDNYQFFIWFDYVRHVLPQILEFASQPATCVNGDGNGTGQGNGDVETEPNQDAISISSSRESDQLSDVIEEERSNHVPSKRTPKKIKYSEPARAARRKARDRVAQFNKYTSNEQLLAMIPSSDTHGELVMVNLIKENQDEQDIFLNDKLSKRLKNHQIDGIRFMWRETIATAEGYALGCILAHTMGLGKTAQVVALLVTLAESIQDPKTRKQIDQDLHTLRVLVLCPSSITPNWRNELKQWTPKPNFFDVYCVEAGGTEDRISIIKSWDEKGGIMIMGFTMFEAILSRRSLSREDAQHESVKEILLHSPNIVIADEAHMLKNAQAKISKHTALFKTQRRIALTGSPMSNNTQEIFALVDWVSPGYLGSAAEFKALYGNPIEQGSYKDSSPYEKRRGKKKLAVLQQEIDPKVNRADITVLKGSLKSMTEFLITVPLTEVQSNAYTDFVTRTSTPGEEISQVRLFGWLSMLTLLCNHPVAFRTKLLQRKGQEEEKVVPTADEEVADQSVNYESTSSLGIGEECVNSLLSSIPDGIPIAGSNKAKLVRQIIELSIQAGDKVLLFSQSLLSIDMCQLLLKAIGCKWGRIDGKVSVKGRHGLLQDMKDLDVMLVSTKAGGLGLNIQAANRVIILDFGFNPSWEQQAIGRAYRLGQTKPVFVYKFITGGTFEEKLNDVILFKTSLTSRVVDKKNPLRIAERSSAAWLFKPKEVKQKDISAELGKDPKVLDKIISNHDPSKGIDCSIRAISRMDTLQQQDSEDEPLNEIEQQEVREEIALIRRTSKRHRTSY